MYVCVFVSVPMCIYISIYNIYEKTCSVSECKIKPAGPTAVLGIIGIITLFTVNIIYLFVLCSLYSNQFLVFYSLIKCQNIVGKTCDKWILPNNNYNVLQAKLYASVCVCEYVCMYICIYMWIVKYHPVTLQTNNCIYFWLHSYRQNKKASK